MSRNKLKNEAIASAPENLIAIAFRNPLHTFTTGTGSIHSKMRCSVSCMDPGSALGRCKSNYDRQTQWACTIQCIDQAAKKIKVKAVMVENYPGMHISMQRSDTGEPQIIGHAEPQSVYLLPWGPIVQLVDISPPPPKKVGLLNMRSRPFTATGYKAKNKLTKII